MNRRKRPSRQNRLGTRHGARALAVLLSAASIALVQGAVSPAVSAAPAHPAGASATSVSSVSTVEDHTARALAASLADPAWRSQVRSAALGSAQVDLRALTGHSTAGAGRALAPAVASADREIAAAKGLTGRADSLLRLRLGTESMRTALTSHTVPWVATPVDDDDAATITAYDSRGGTHTLDVQKAPRHPVYIVDVDVSKAVAAGMRVVNGELAARGLSDAARTGGAGKATKLASDGFWTTKVDAVRLDDDEEPWPEGNAEVFSIVSGFGFDGHVSVNTVQMPYLDDDGVTYYPNQVVVNWSSYKYNLADLVMMEDDGDTNYGALAKALADALLTITDNGAYVPLVNAILDAIPTSWWTNDPDYVDSWYTLGVNTSGTLNGARGNGVMTVEPYWVSGL